MAKRSKNTKKKAKITRNSKIQVPFHQTLGFQRTVVATVIFLIIISAIFFLKGANPFTDKNSTVETSDLQMYELTEDDVLLNNSITANQIAVLGVKLGDTGEKVIDSISQPDNITQFKNGQIKNFYYRESLGCERTCVLYHIENDSVTRISIFEDFNSRLIGDTKLDHDKSWIYFNLGIPDSFIDSKHMRRFIYSPRGLEVYLLRMHQMGYALFKPDPSKKRNVTKTNITEEDILAPPTIPGDADKFGNDSIEHVLAPVENPDVDVETPGLGMR